MRIGSKITSAIVLAVVVTVAGITGMVNVEVKDALTGQFRTSASSQLSQMSAFVELFMDTAKSNAESVASSKSLEGVVENLSNYVNQKGGVTTNGNTLPESERLLYSDLENMNRSFSNYLLVYVANNQGGITLAPNTSLPEGFNPSKRAWYLDAQASGKSIITEAYLSADGSTVTTIATPVLKNGRSVGVAALDISLDTLHEQVSAAKIGKTGYMILVNPFNQIISARTVGGTQSWIGKKFTDLPQNVVGDLQKALQVNNHNAAFESIELDDKKWLLDVYKDNAGWSYIMLQEEAEVFADAMGITISILMAGIVLIIIMACLAYLLSRTIAKPVEILANASDQVAHGNLDAIPQDTSLFRGELALLHQSLLGMVAKLSELISTANEKIKEAEKALEQSHAATLEAEKAKEQGELAKREGILQAADTISQVVERLNSATSALLNEVQISEQLTSSQNIRLNQINASMGEMNHVVTEVAQTTVKTASLADNTFSEAQQGRRLMLNVIANMQEIEQQSLSMREGLEALGGQAESIDVIMNVISDIADQTNLLALNAAIEAARAGEAGRGFAVVADEVRKLAEKTMEATKQVNLAITSIQKSTHTNMTAMRDAADFIGKSSQVVDQASVSLSNIEELADSTASEIRSIASASEEQAASSHEMKDNINQMSEATKELAAGEVRAEQAVVELLNSAKELARVIDHFRSGSI